MSLCVITVDRGTYKKFLGEAHPFAKVKFENSRKRNMHVQIHIDQQVTLPFHIDSPGGNFYSVHNAASFTEFLRFLMHWAVYSFILTIIIHFLYWAVNGQITYSSANKNAV